MGLCCREIRKARTEAGRSFRRSVAVSPTGVMRECVGGAQEFEKHISERNSAVLRFCCENVGGVGGGGV